MRARIRGALCCGCAQCVCLVCLVYVFSVCCVLYRWLATMLHGLALVGTHRYAYWTPGLPSTSSINSPSTSMQPPKPLNQPLISCPLFLLVFAPPCLSLRSRSFRPSPAAPRCLLSLFLHLVRACHALHHWLLFTSCGCCQRLHLQPQASCQHCAERRRGRYRTQNSSFFFCLCLLFCLFVRACLCLVCLVCVCLVCLVCVCECVCLRGQG